MTRIRRGAVPILLGLLLGGQAIAADRMSTREMEELGTRDAQRTMREDLQSILEPEDSFDSGMFVVLNGATFLTQPFGTEFPGLCGRDYMWVRYAAAGDARRPEDRPVAPYGLELLHQFNFAKVPTAGTVEKADEGGIGTEVFRPECRHVQADGPGWFTADNADTAVYGFLALQAALRRLEQGSLTPETCDLFPRNEDSCITTAAKLGDPASLGSIERCGSDAAEQCFEIGGLSTRITIRTRYSGRVATPDDVLSVKVEQYIIVT